ncbi:zinc finger transcriptional activator [Didymosphaeria variabile]|uniref:Zinc finger transcriptional activator n=1 Tax=Didymosphaeria variabile TaxID=1932322 RepID=A0A9W9CAJ9_9PLEO|nr:zinc finger transcriptional activator [Didymosphaeria variabile]KAJ4351821.1 zinc finger transcriptional activator [Didymosphaeria variabile]
MSGDVTNASPPGRTSQPPSHTRTYQACIPCRRRKVRCDLGPVDNPHDPPCVRCRRESKECFFSATRRKRKTDGGELEDDDDYELRNGRKRARTEDDVQIPAPLTAPTGSSSSASQYVSQPLTPGGSVGRYEPLRRPTTSHAPHNDDEDQKLNDKSMAVMQTGEIYSGHDALNLLFEAAGRNGDIEHHRTGSASSLQRPSMLGPASTPGSQANFASPQAQSHARNHSRATAAEPAVDPAISQQYTSLPEPPNEAAFAEAIKAWTKFRFVRAGWMTAKEAVRYIDYFYTYLSPLTPIVVPDYRDHALHAKLLKEEPMLVITLLTIATRFRTTDFPQGPGAISRAYLIHEKLWKYLQGMIDRMIFGQEQFGGGFCGAGQQPGSDVNPLSRKGLRTLGTVESLMLLTEWHPRALHFPPGDDDDELVLPDDSFEADIPANATAAEHLKGESGQRIDSWLEPCWRSDRMCWMLLGNAVSLAFEIGVFDETSEIEFEEANQHLSHATVKAYFRRKNHLKDLLIIYVTQTSGRLGLTSMLPQVKRDSDSVMQKTPLELYQERVARIKAPPPHHGMRPDGQRLPLESVATQERHAVQDLVLDFWDRIAKIMEIGNLKLFPNRRRTRDLLKSGKYEELLQNFQTPLIDWKRGFEAAPQVPPQLRHVLAIEYEYTRVYVNSLALQAVVERCTHNTPQQTHAQPNGMGSSTNDEGSAIPFSTLTRWYGNDRHHIDEVVSASRNVLSIVVNGLYPEGYLRHAPVRTFFRIVSVAIILLKTFALGATEKDVAKTLGLLDQAVYALRTSIVDDVHVGNRFADLVDTLTHRIRGRFVRLAANGSTGNSRGVTPPPRSRGETPMGPPPATYLPQNLNGAANANPNFTFGNFTGFSRPGSPGNRGITASGRATPIPEYNSLAGISLESYDPTSNQISIMPPPGFPANGFIGKVDGNSNGNPGWQAQNWSGANGNANGGFQNEDWLALPLDPLLDQWGADISQTAMGPDVGGMDMLDILLNMGGPPGSA